MRIKSFSLFESFDDSLDILSVVKDMLLDLSDLDYVTNCVIRRMDSREYIRIGISKIVISEDNSFEWVDIKEIMDPIIDYLASEGYQYRKDKGTLSYEGNPIIITSGSGLYFDGGIIKSRCEMWFEKI